jgi:hypothetical protein
MLLIKWYMMSIEVGLAGHVERMGDRRDADRVLMGRPEGRRPRGRIILKY